MFPLKELQDAIEDYLDKERSQLRLGHLHAMLVESLTAVEKAIKEETDEEA